MCGLAGYIGPNALGAPEIERTLSLLARRGPDDEGCIIKDFGTNKASLLHTRLAIIDLDARSAQPFLSDDCTLVYNGEIYNFIELRARLKMEGHHFRTDSDTEVVVKAYRAWGIACLSEFEGMFAFALLDERSGEMILARDAFGEKPLYYMQQGNEFYFASQIKQLKAMGADLGHLNSDRMYRFLAYGYRQLDVKPDTYYTNVFSLPAASYVILKTAKQPLEIKRYWQLEYKPTAMSLSDASAGVKERLLHALEIRLRSDVPIALTLSGGIDSNVIAGLVYKHFGERLHAFSMYDSHENFNEEPLIREAVTALGCPHHSTRVSTDGFIDRLSRMVDWFDEPVSATGMYLDGFLAESVQAAGYKVALSGIGSDELFLGYYDHYLYWLAGQRNSPDYADKLSEWDTSFGKWVRNPWLQDPNRFHETPQERRHIHLNAPNIDEYLTKSPYPLIEEAHYCDDLLRRRMLNEVNREAVPVYLHNGDLNWMYHSIENRTAYLDKELAQFLFTVPSEHLIHDGYTKYLLRQAGEGYVAPSVLHKKRKMGFNASLSSLLDRNDLDLRDRLMVDSPVFDILRKDKMEKLLHPETSLAGLENLLFCFVSAQLFMEHQRT